MFQDNAGGRLSNEAYMPVHWGNMLVPVGMYARLLGARAFSVGYVP